LCDPDQVAFRIEELTDDESGLGNSVAAHDAPAAEAFRLLE
jgi:hypothetical protein